MPNYSCSDSLIANSNITSHHEPPNAPASWSDNGWEASADVQPMTTASVNHYMSDQWRGSKLEASTFHRSWQTLTLSNYQASVKWNVTPWCMLEFKFRILYIQFAVKIETRDSMHRPHIGTRNMSEFVIVPHLRNTRISNFSGTGWCDKRALAHVE